MSTAILLVNLGTPDAPTTADLRRYLAEFLSDPRVVDLPHWLWLPLLHGVILNTRPSKSAAKYAAIWTPAGSPLKVYTEQQARLLAKLLGKRGHEDLRVDWAMRYGNPPIHIVLDRLATGGASEILIVPLYPQFAGSTTASTHDAVDAWLKRSRRQPVIRWVEDFHVDPGYINALAASIRDHWAKHGRSDKLLMSFHGIPQRCVDRGDPYANQCHATARATAAALGLPADAWLTAFQSRFGATRWLQPYTQQTLEELARSGIRSIDVVCPGFPADCLETLEEIAVECRAAFLHAGGLTFQYIPCLNQRDDWIAALADIVLARLSA